MREDIIGCDGCDGENYKSEQRKKETEKFGFLMGFACQNQMFFLFFMFIYFLFCFKQSKLAEQASL
jgi:hypothetical protein